MNIVLGCDSAAVDLAETILKFVRDKGHQVEFVGVESPTDDTYYPLIAKKVAEKIISSRYEKRGILLCGTGIGMAMTANKFPGIRAAVCHDNFSAERSVLSNDGNVLCMGARVIGPELAKKITAEWLNLKFVDGSSTPKVKVIKDIENENFACGRK
jgi:ribose 5-phosphate isomerase B